MKIYLAATEDMYRGRATVDAHRMLISYWGKESRFQVALDHAGNPEDWCVDSGAHFFISAFFKHGKKPSVTEVEEHIEKLCSYIRSLETKPSWTVEMDLQDFMGIDLILDWRERYWKPLERETGVRIAYGHHMTDGYSHWRSLLDDPEVNFMAVAMPKGSDTNLYSSLVHEAYEAGKPVHGFACVQAKRMKTIPFYSVDSTSWAAGSIFGTIPRFNFKTGVIQTSQVGRAARKTNRRASLAALLRHKGRVHPKDTQGANAGGSLSRIYQNSAAEFEKQERWMTAFWKARGIDWDAKTT